MAEELEESEDQLLCTQRVDLIPHLQAFLAKPGYMIRIYRVAESAYRVNWWNRKTDRIEISQLIYASQEGDSIVYEPASRQ